MKLKFVFAVLCALQGVFGAADLVVLLDTPKLLKRLDQPRAFIKKLAACENKLILKTSYHMPAEKYTELLNLLTTNIEDEEIKALSIEVDRQFFFQHPESHYLPLYPDFCHLV